MNLFSFIKGRVSIVDVVSDYANLKKAGHYLKATCPFHHEKTASFTVSPHKEIYYCFGCHSGGDVISFIAKAEQCTQLEAAQHIAERFNIELPAEILKLDKQAASQSADAKKRYWQLCDIITKWTVQQLKKNEPAQAYLAQRAITDQTAGHFALGFFPSGNQAMSSLIDAVRAHSFLAHDLLATHVLVENKGHYYSPLADRITFPIYDTMGRCVGFGGRIFKPNDERPKYYNCKESPFFVKGSLLFGFDTAKKQIQEKNAVFLVEGYLDCITMVQHGYRNTVATLGTACTHEQLKLLARHAQQVYVLYDGDAAGKKAMLRLTELCWHVNLELRILELPTGTDPDSFLRSGSSLEPLIAQAQDIFFFFIKTIGKGFAHKTLQEKLEIIRELLEVIAKIDDQLKKDILLGQVANTCDMAFSALSAECARIAGGTQPESHHPKAPQSPSSSETVALLEQVPLLEKKLFSVIINNMNLVKNEDEEYLIEYATPPVRDLLKKMQQVKKEHAPIDFSLFFESLAAHEKIMLSQLLLSCYEYEGAENLDYLLTQFQKKNWKSFVSDTKIKLSRAKLNNDTQSIQKILTHFQELKQKLVSRGLV
jgi:DNA primase